MSRIDGVMRYYPLSCTSQYCGKTKNTNPPCNESCRFYKDLQEFEQWKKETMAVQIDPIWHPLVYEETITE